jgi:allantoin racemase
MRLCCINVNAEETSQAFLPVLYRDMELACRADTTITIKCVDPGLERALDINSAYFTLLNKASIVNKAREAAAEGYDAVMVLCFLDPGVREAREVVDIPVIGVAEASMFLACQMGGKFAIVTLDEHKMMLEIERNLKLYGLEDRVTPNPIVPIAIPSRDWMTRGMQEPEWVAAEIKEKARRCVEDGAEVVVIGCAALGPLATLGGVSKIEGLEVPIIDCVQAGLKMAELRVELAQKLGWPVASRAGMYAMPRERDIERVHQTFGIGARARAK